MEFKHLNKAQAKADGAVKRALEKALEKALTQARRYARCSNLRGIANLKCVAAVYAGTSLAALVTEDGGGEAQS